MQPGVDSGVRLTEERAGRKTGLSRYTKLTSFSFLNIFNMDCTFCTACKIAM